MQKQRDDDDDDDRDHHRESAALTCHSLRLTGCPAEVPGYLQPHDRVDRQQNQSSQQYRGTRGSMSGFLLATTPWYA